jgi:hypothetical protein
VTPPPELTDQGDGKADGRGEVSGKVQELTQNFEKAVYEHRDRDHGEDNAVSQDVRTWTITDTNQNNGLR